MIIKIHFYTKRIQTQILKNKESESTTLIKNNENLKCERHPFKRNSWENITEDQWQQSRDQINFLSNEKYWLFSSARFVDPNPSPTPQKKLYKISFTRSCNGCLYKLSSVMHKSLTKFHAYIRISVWLRPCGP